MRMKLGSAVLNLLRLRRARRELPLVTAARPARADIEPTTVCNFRCPHCPTTGGVPGFVRRHMSLAEFTSVLDQLPTVYRIKLVGLGEPLLNPDFFAMVREAIALVEEGLATPREVDRIVKSSFGFRLGAYGPFEIIDQAGADTYLSVYSYLFAKLGKEHFRPPRLLEEQVARGRLGLKSRGGFYEYGAEAADATRRDRDRKLYARLSLARRERDRGAVTGSSESASTEPRP